MSHLILETPRSYQQVSIVLQTGVTESLKNLNWMSSAFWFLVVFHAIKVERNQKKKEERKEKMKTVKNPFYFQQYLLAGNIKNYPLQKLRKWNSLQIICTTKALSYWTILQWASLSCSQTAFQEFWALKANRTKFTCPCHFYHMWTQTHTHKGM